MSRNEYVKFYSENDFAIGANLILMQNKLKTLDFKNKFEINEIIELHNIIQYIQCGRFFSDWDEEYREYLKDLLPKLKQEINKYFSNITKNGTFLRCYSSVHNFYIKDFFYLFDKYKVYTKIDKNELNSFVENNPKTLNQLLYYKGITRHYSDKLRELMIKFPLSVAENIIRKYCSSEDILFNKKSINIPNLLTSDDINMIIQLYIDSEIVNWNFLRLLPKAKSEKIFKLTEKVKKNAKQKIKEIEREFLRKENKIYSEYIVKIEELKEYKKIIYNNRKTEIVYDKKWLEQTLDYNSILQNFIYIFDFVDNNFRIDAYSKISEIGVFERTIGIRGNYEYPNFMFFQRKQIISMLSLKSYVSFLEENNIFLEDVIKYFFEDYLNNEFSINNYQIYFSNRKEMYKGKCASLFPEIENVLKQYKCYVDIHEIDKNVIDDMGHTILFEFLESLNKNKNFYPKGKLKDIIDILFSDQTGLGYLPNRNIKEDNFAKAMYINSLENINYNDYPKSKHPQLNYLLSEKIIKVDDKKNISFVSEYCITVLFWFYQNGNINFYRVPNKYQTILSELLNQDLVETDSYLFSKQEADYFDYYLNNRKFNNGYALKNLYSHGFFETNEAVHKSNYYIGLYLLILIIIKMNDDLCIYFDTKNSDNKTKKVKDNCLSS